MKIKGTIQIPVEIDIKNNSDNITNIEYPSNIDELIEKSVVKILAENNIKNIHKIEEWYNFPFPCGFIKD